MVVDMGRQAEHALEPSSIDLYGYAMLNLLDG